jgi:hypothetical protein
MTPHASGDDRTKTRVASFKLLPKACLLPHLNAPQEGPWGSQMRKVSMARRRELVPTIGRRRVVIQASDEDRPLRDRDHPYG